MSQEIKSKIALYLLDKAVNTSSRKLTKPRDYKEILDNKATVEHIGLDINSAYNQATIRVSFIGSEKYFTMGIEYDKMDYWYQKVKLFYLVDPLALEFDMDSIDIDNLGEDCEANKSIGRDTSGVTLDKTEEQKEEYPRSDRVIDGESKVNTMPPKPNIF